MMEDETEALAEAAMQAQIASAAEVKEQREVAYYMGLIQEKVQRYLRLPPSSNRDISVTIEIRLYPDGEVISADIVQSSGMTSFDNAALEAIRMSRSLPVPNDVGMFRRNFARFNAVVRPGDIKF